MCRVGIAGRGLGVGGWTPPVHVYRRSSFEWKSALNFNPWAKFQTIRQLTPLVLLGQLQHCVCMYCSEWTTYKKSQRAVWQSVKATMSPAVCSLYVCLSHSLYVVCADVAAVSRQRRRQLTRSLTLRAMMLSQQDRSQRLRSLCITGLFKILPDFNIS